MYYLATAYSKFLDHRTACDSHKSLHLSRIMVGILVFDEVSKGRRKVLKRLCLSSVFHRCFAFSTERMIKDQHVQHQISDFLREQRCPMIAKCCLEQLIHGITVSDQRTQEEIDRIMLFRCCASATICCFSDQSATNGRTHTFNNLLTFSAVLWLRDLGSNKR